MEILKTDIFDKWLRKLKDKKAKAIIQVHINRLIEDNLGKLRSVGIGLNEKKSIMDQGTESISFTMVNV